MKDMIKTMQLNRLSRLLAGLGVICLLGLAVPADGFACHKGEPHGKDTGCGSPPPEGEVELEITYEFGELTVDCGTGPECVSTTITATGTVECDNLKCDFNSTSVYAPFDFDLPSGLWALLSETVWRGTPLDPDNCFGYAGADSAGTALIDNGVVFLRRFNNGATPWYASVGTWALDIKGSDPRQYDFNFEGCGETSCGDFGPESMVGLYIGGALKAIGAHGNDRKFLSIPCRCTKSNTPDCPHLVPGGPPPIRIEVK